MLTKFKSWKLREGDLLYWVGSRNLSNRDLLAHILQDVGLAESLLYEYGTLDEIGKLSLSELRKILSSDAKADALYSAYELSRRYGNLCSERVTINSPADVARLMIPIMRGLEQEHLYVLILDTKSRVKKMECIFVGSLNASIIHPREIFKIAIKESAASMILTHNHPSGETSPSREDIAATKQMIEAGKLLQIPILDHIIIGDGTYSSMKEAGLI